MSKLRQALRFALVMWISATVIGCAPITYTYYKPSAPGAKHRSCTGCSHRGEFNNDGLQLSISVGNFYGPNNSISLCAEVPVGKSAVFLSDELEFITDNSVESTKFRLGKIQYTVYPDAVLVFMLPTEVMTGHRDFSFQMRSYCTSAVIAKNLTPDTFSVKLPNILLDTTKIEYPVVTFTKKEGFGIITIK